MNMLKPQPGFPHKDISWLFGLIAVRAPLAKIKALATPAAQGETRESHAFQADSSDYSVLSWDKCEPELSKWLSKRLKTTVAYLWDEDTSGWFGYSVFKNGTEVEVFQFGANYEDELGGLAEELGESVTTLKKRQKGWDVFATQDGEDFQFRSKLVKVPKKDLLKGLTFVDTRFKTLGIPIPRQFPKDQEVISWPLA
jgi:hypothetical protein